MDISEQLTFQFYRWENRCRGWYAYPYVVDPEPPFEPFFGHYIFEGDIIDDGRKETLISSFIKAFKAEEPKRTKPKRQDEPEPFKAFEISVEDLISLSLLLPEGYKARFADFEQLFVMLSFTQHPITFELYAHHTEITLRLICNRRDTRFIESQLKGYFPEIVVEVEDAGAVPLVIDYKEAFVQDFGLEEEFTRPILTHASSDYDPYTALFSVLEHLNDGEGVTLQITFKSTVNSWGDSILHSVTGSDGKTFFENAPEMLPLAKEKISAPLFAVNVRAIIQGRTVDSVAHLARSIVHTISEATRSPYNRIIPLSFEGYNQDFLAENIVRRQSRRLGMVLNAKELLSLVHFPSPRIQSKKLRCIAIRTKEAPVISEGHSFCLGHNTHNGNEKEVSVTPALRLRHTHIIGSTGTGKSTALLSFIIQDMYIGNGVAVLDPHGDLIEAILPYVPENRISDVVIIDPSDTDFPVAFNILSAHSEMEKELLSSDLVAIFRRMSTSWGDQMNSVFANAIIAFLESTECGTLIDLRKFLIEKGYREQFLKTVQDPHIVYYWQKEYPLLKSSSIGSILTRLDAFLRPKTIRNMVSQKKGLDFSRFLDEQKIVLIKLSEGLIGSENSYTLGALIVAKIQQAAMARQSLKKEDRKDFFLYIDEFQNFATPSMISILTGARKYHLGLVLAHQDMEQLAKRDSELANSVLSNTGIRMCFRLGDADARKLEQGFSYFEAKDLQNLSVGKAIARLETAENDFNLSVFKFQELEKEVAEDIAEKVRALSQRTYGTPKETFDTPITRDVFPEMETEEESEIVLPKEKTKPKPLHPLSEEAQEETVNIVVARKEQSEHRYLQNLIMKMAETRGFIARLEEPVQGGFVDVMLERSGIKYACEITISTTTEWEIHNIEKCVSAGYATVFVCSTDKRRLQKIAEELRTLTVKSASIHTYTPEELFFHLDTIVAKDASAEKTVKGYRVKVEYSAIPESESEIKRQRILKAITERKNK